MARDDQHVSPPSPLAPSPRHAGARAASVAPAEPALPKGRRNYLLDGAQADTTKLHVAEPPRELAPLAEQLVDDAWKVDAMPGSMPAGYTFLAQLVAHDVAARTVNPGERYSEDPARKHGLTLDSIFGPLDGSYPVPRYYHFRPSASDEGRPVAVDLLWKGNKADVYDDRNGDTPFLSQITALFLRYHDLAKDRLARDFPADQASALARCLTIEAYLSIVEHDLLARLLHPAVLAHVRAAGWQPADAASAGDGFDIPVEFTNAAFRFGHAMVRSTYLLNDRSPVLTLSDLIGPVPELDTIRAENSNFWRADWRLFFGDGPKVQMARRIGPDLPPDLEQTGKNRVVPGGRKSDMALRDLVSSSTGKLQNISALAGMLAPHLSGRAGLSNWAFWSESGRNVMMTDWLNLQPGRKPAHFASDPPLFLYVLIESGAAGTVSGFGEGRTLGALGSVLIADVVVPRIRKAQAYVDAQPDIARARGMFPATAQKPATMWDFVALLTEME